MSQQLENRVWVAFALTDTLDLHRRYNVDEIFEEISGHHDNNIRIEAAKPERIVQQLIITNRIPELISLLAEWCDTDSVNSNLVRLAAHIVIFFRTVGLQYNKQKTDEILRRYVMVGKSMRARVTLLFGEIHYLSANSFM